MDIGFGWNVEALGFAYGFLLGDEKCKKRIYEVLNKRYISTLLLTFVLSGILGVLYLKHKTVFFWGEYLIRAVLGIALIALVFTVLYRIRLENKVNVLLGNISYEIYLLHGFVICVLSLIEKQLDSGIFIILVVAMSILISIPLHRINQCIVGKIKK